MSVKKFRAKVTNLEDPEKRGRFKVSCPEYLFSDQEMPFWIEPELQHGWFNIPYINQQIIIEVNVDAEDGNENGLQNLIMAPIFIWRGEVAFTNDDYESSHVVDEKFKENYTYRRGFMTKKGLCIIFDDSDEGESIEINWTNKLKQEASISIDKTGSIVAEDASGNVVSLDAKALKISAIHSLGAKIDLTATGISLDGPVITSNGIATNTVTGGATTISGGTVALAPTGTLTITAGANVTFDAPFVQLTSGAIRTILKSPEFLAFFDAHVHTPSGPPLFAFTGPPVVLGTPLLLTLTEPKVLI